MVVVGPTMEVRSERSPPRYELKFEYGWNSMYEFDASIHLFELE